MSNHSKKLGRVVSIDEAKIHDHVGEFVRGTMEETLNAMLDAEADALCGVQRYERSPDRVDTRAGSYQRQFHTKADESHPQDAQATQADLRDGDHRTLSA